MDFDYRAMTVRHKGQAAVIAFDFIPPRPTATQLSDLCRQTCASCPYPRRAITDRVEIPAFRLAEDCPAYSRHFLDLYKRTMSGKLHGYQKTCGGLLLMPSAVK